MVMFHLVFFGFNVYQRVTHQLGWFLSVLEPSQNHQNWGHIEAMMSDFTCGFLLLAKVEGVAVFPWYLSTPPPAANATIQYWKESGQWLPGVDETAPQPAWVVDLVDVPLVTWGCAMEKHHFSWVKWWTSAVEHCKAWHFWGNPLSAIASMTI